jgi:pimeloyl-ACP methyl ester carboxylesterase
MNQTQTSVKLELDDVILSGDLLVPENSRGIVLFVHGSGSSRFSPRNKRVAKLLNNAGLATLLFDLLTPQEETIDKLSAEYRFNIDLLASRVVATLNWLQEKMNKSLSVGLFGASTGAAAALIAAAQLPDKVDAVVSRGGRPDLAREYLHLVKASTLLIVGGNDTTVIELNRSAFDLLKVEKKLEIIKGASHLFEEPGALEIVAQLSIDWFSRFPQ